MPWEETTRMSRRVQFIAAFDSCQYSMTELCERYGISRKTGYKWTGRYGKEGLDGLKDRSRAPKSCPHGTSEETSEKLLELRRSHPTWGPRKLLAWLGKREPETIWPAASTVGGILKQHGLVEERGRSRRAWPPSGRPSVQAAAPNQVWSCDFKGQFRTGDGRSVLSADGGRRVQPVPSGGPRAGLGGRVSGLAGVRTAVSGVRSAGGDP